MQVNTFQTVERIVFGAGSLGNLPDEIRRLGGQRVFLVTDPGIEAAGLLDRLVGIIDGAAIDRGVFASVEPEPTVDVALDCLRATRDFSPDVIVGFGGGSSLDIAKVTAVLLTNAGPVEACFGVERIGKAGLPTVLIPTTAGTGSEVTSIAVLSEPRSGMKRGIVSEHLFANTALLDPELTVGLPPHITASTGLDALIHAVESYIGRRATAVTEPLAFSAIRRIVRCLPAVHRDGADLAARTGMLEGSLLAGMAFANTQTGGCHACGLPLGSMFHLPHGIAVSVMLPAVMRFNAGAVPEKFARIGQAMGVSADGLAPLERAHRSIDALTDLIRCVDVKLGLKNYDVRPECIPDLVRGAAEADRLWANNPRPATEIQMQRIFEDAFGPAQ